MKDGQEACGRLVVSGSSGAEALQVVEEALHAIADAVEAAVEAPTLLPTGMRVNDRLHVVRADAFNDAVRVVACISDDERPLGVEDQFLGDRRFMLLTWRDRDVERSTARRSDGVNLC